VVVRLSNEDDEEDDNTEENTTTPIASSTNKVLLLAGDIDDVVSIKQSNSLNLNKNMTLEAWINPTEWQNDKTVSSTTENVIISKGSIDGNLEYALTLDKGKLVFSNNKSKIWTTDPVVSLNKWTHVAVTTDDASGVVNLYVDNVKITNIKQGSRTSGGANTFDKSDAITEATSTAEIGNVYIGNFYNKYCDSQIENGFVGKIDDVRIWNVTRTETEISTNLDKSVKNSAGLVGYWSFDNSSAVDITIFANNGYIKGSARSVVDNTSPTPIVSATSLLTFAFNPDMGCQYRMPDFSVATTTEPMGPTPHADVNGLVTRVTKCTDSPGDFDLTEVEIEPCGDDQNVQRYVDGVPTGGFRGNIFITLRNNKHQPPKVGDVIIAKVVLDKGGTCSALAGGVAPSTYNYEGIISGPYSSGPDETGVCSSGGDGGGGPSLWVQFRDALTVVPEFSISPLRNLFGW
jgi:tellurite resistance-related uncharacterized protein